MAPAERNGSAMVTVLPLSCLAFARQVSHSRGHALSYATGGSAIESEVSRNRSHGRTSQLVTGWHHVVEPG